MIRQVERFIWHAGKPEIGERSAPTTGQQAGKRPRHDAVEQRTEDRRPEAADREAIDQRAGQPEHQAVQDEDEEPEREQRDRQRQQQQEGAQYGVHQPEDQRREQRCAERRDVNRRHHVGDGEQRNGVEYPEQDSRMAAPWLA